MRTKQDDALDFFNTERLKPKAITTRELKRVADTKATLKKAKKTKDAVGGGYTQKTPTIDPRLAKEKLAKATARLEKKSLEIEANKRQIKTFLDHASDKMLAKVALFISKMAIE